MNTSQSAEFGDSDSARNDFSSVDSNLDHWFPQTDQQFNDSHGNSKNGYSKLAWATSIDYRQPIAAPNSMPLTAEAPQSTEVMLDPLADLIAVQEIEEIGTLDGHNSDSSLLDALFETKELTDEELRQQIFSFFELRPIPLWKRSFDLVFSILLIFFLSPLWIGIALFIRLTSGGPVLFKQKRVGLMGNEFEIYKFRTMKSEDTATTEHQQYIADRSRCEEPIGKPDHSDRLIFGGRWIRGLSLDELPQLINIIKGEMSLIGPRPDVLDWKDYEKSQLQRFEVTPGVTGLWQVTGKNSLSFREMIEKDIHYVENRSISLDLWIILKTFPLLLKGDNR